jgi:hypothetical protein
LLVAGNAAPSAAYGVGFCHQRVAAFVNSTQNSPALFLL